MRRIYLDQNATTPLAPEALAAMLPFLSGGYEGRFGNPSSLHADGRDAQAAVDDARVRLAALLGGHPRDLIFTGGGTEADNLAVIGLARARVRAGSQRHVITSQIEHHAVLHAADFLERHEGFRVTRLPVDGRGIIDPEALRGALTGGTALVSLQSANNETGTIQPIGELAALCRENGVPFHSDTVQSFGKQPVRVDTPGAPDAISLAAHKFYGPKGTGALWVRPGLKPDAILFGGAQEGERRPGTESPALLAGMATAAELAVNALPTETPRLAALRDRLWMGIAAHFPAAARNGAWETPALQLANTLNVSFPGVDGETLLIHCDLEGLSVSGGSACMAGSQQPSHVLLAMGRTLETARASLRFSLGKGTDEADIDAALERLAKIFARLKP
ncbi:MAG: cysteine desulfurase family protein [Chthoniobacteraceae bacterium]|nr:cysteine desulfurase family protein [Chthoniobacteraceae bacterium]